MLRKKCKFCTVFARVIKHARNSLFIIVSVFFFVCFFIIIIIFILRAQITLADILRIIQTPRERKLAPNLNLSK